MWRSYSKRNDTLWPAPCHMPQPSGLTSASPSRWAQCASDHHRARDAPGVLRGGAGERGEAAVHPDTVGVVRARHRASMRSGRHLRSSDSQPRRAATL